MSATAENREIVAMEPLSLYVNGAFGCLPASLRLIASAAYRPPWMATWATPGSLSSAIMSPTTCTSGCPGRVRSGCTDDPAGPVDLGAGLLAEDPAQRGGLDAGGPDLGGGVDPADLAVGVLDLEAVGVDVGDHRAELHLDADPVELPAGAAAELLAERRQHARRGVEQDDPRLVGSMLRKSPRRVRRASSAIWPAISTPVGPAPTTTKVISRSISAWSVASSASSKAPKMRPRSSRASSMLFMPGANSANWSLPK